MNQEDKEFLDGLLKKDSKVLQKIYDFFFPGISSYVKELGGTTEDAQDVFQDGIVVMYRQLKSGNLTLTSSFYTYLFAVCKNIWLKNRSRSHRRNTQLKRITIKIEVEAEVESFIEQTERNRFFREKFKLLGRDCQQVLNLFFAGTSMKEIAQIMDYGSEGYAKKRKCTCRKKLFQLVQNDQRFEDFKN